MGQYFILQAKVLVGIGTVSLYELQTRIKISNNGYTAKSIQPVDDNLMIEIAPLQIEIPAYETIKFDKIED